MEGEGFQKTSKGVSVRTACHRNSGQSGKAQMVLKNGKLDGRGQPTCSAARTLSLTEGKRSRHSRPGWNVGGRTR